MRDEQFYTCMRVVIDTSTTREPCGFDTREQRNGTNTVHEKERKRGGKYGKKKT